MIEIIGIFAAILTTGSFLPQAILVFKTGETAAISVMMYIMLTAGKASWLAYGVMTISLPLILANSLTLVLALMILALKVKAMTKTNGKKSAKTALA